jgi:glycine reductase complex component B subunit gamma
MIRVVHYINQFFGQIGGEEKAGVPPRIIDGAKGPGLLIDRILGEQGGVAATVICGDNYFAERMDVASEELFRMIRSVACDLFVAGPAFNAGRYGIACGEMCRRVQEELGLPVTTGMYRENPGVDLYRRVIHIIETSKNAAGMAKDMRKMINLGLKILRRESLGGPEEEGYVPQGLKKTVLSKTFAAERAIGLLLKKMKGEPFGTEIAFSDLDAVPPAPAVIDLSKAIIAVVTEGGLVPKDNPDRIESGWATRWGKYSIDELATCGADKFSSVHRGFDTIYVNEDPDRLVPVDVLKELEEEGVFGKLHESFLVTTGVATSMENAQRMGREMARDLNTAGVSGVILTAT